ncbi:unnamed protein product, partial [Iphiclides podalirius]
MTDSSSQVLGRPGEDGAAEPQPSAQTTPAIHSRYPTYDALVYDAGAPTPHMFPQETTATTTLEHGKPSIPAVSGPPLSPCRAMILTKTINAKPSYACLRSIVLDEFTVPACLHDGHHLNDSTAMVTGWGTTVFRTDKVSDVLQKVTLQKFTDEQCALSYAPNSPGMRHMKKGLNSTTQMCYGDWHVAKDSCNGDSGGPVQVKHPHVYCMYSVLGITSWGKQCGQPGEPAIYTRLVPYVPWIESIVWP